MAALINTGGQSGLSLYAFIRDKAGQIWNGSTFVAYNVLNWAAYAVTLTEQASSGFYSASFPSAIAAGKYSIIVHASQGSPAAGDQVFDQGYIYWDGTEEDQGIKVILKAMGLDGLISAAAGSLTVGSFLDLILNKNSSQTFDQSTDSLEALRDGGTGGPTAEQIADAVWDEVLDGSHVVGDSGAERLKAIDDKLPTGDISDFDPASENVNLGANQSGATIGTVNNLGPNAKAHVNAEVVDVMAADLLPEMVAGKPPSTPTFLQAIMYLYMKLRNKQSATPAEEKIYNNSGAVITKATISDDGNQTTKEQFEAP
jgi:hypothetical protein